MFLDLRDIFETREVIMTNLKQLELIQQAFNLVVEDTREYMRGLFRDNPLKEVYSSKYYAENSATLHKNYDELLKLLKVKFEKFPSKLLDIDLYGSIMLSTSDNKFDEIKFICHLNNCMSSYHRLPILMSYTGSNPLPTEAFFNGEIRSAVPEKAHGQHTSNLRLNHPEYTILLNKIDLLRLYGCTKGFEQEQISNKLFGPGVHELDIAYDLYKIIENYLKHQANNNDPLNHKKETAKKIKELLMKGNKLLGHDRNTKDILAHIALACTGVGLLVMIGNWFLNDSFFLNKTNRQIIAEQITEESRRVLTAG